MAIGKTFCRLAFILCAVSLGGTALAQPDYPSKPIRFLVGSVPGGATDILARAVGAKLAENLRQQVVIDNRPGANQMIAADMTAKSPPDGYTILMVPSGFTINPAIYAKLAFDPIRDFSPISLVANVPNVLVIHPSIPARSVKALVALLRKKPGQMVYASSGVGSPSHLAGELFKLLAKVEFTHVPYKGQGQAMIDLLGGHLQLAFPSIPASIPHIRTGKLIALGVTPSRRISSLPNVPTIDEAGVTGYEVSGWYGVLGPGKMPKNLVTRINGEINRILQSAETRELLSNQGADPLTATPEEFAATIATDLVKWAKVVASAGIKTEQ